MKKKYYYKWHDEKEVEIVKAFKDGESEWLVVTDGDYFNVVRKEDLKDVKQTRHYIKKKELEKEIETLEKKKDKLIKKIRKEAVNSLIFRMKFNLIFSEVDNANELSKIGLLIVKELKKIIKDKKTEL